MKEMLLAPHFDEEVGFLELELRQKRRREGSRESLRGQECSVWIWGVARRCGARGDWGRSRGGLECLCK